jgi:putative hydrolase of the HAD superfamily
MVAAYYVAAMVKQHFAHIDTWVFDLDNTLYCPSVRLFDQIEVKMTDYVMRVLKVDRDEADRLRDQYWHDHGTTLAGLMREQEMEPHDYLVAVHDISFDALTPDPDLRVRISALPGRRIVYTNGSAPYAERVIEKRGLTGVFDAVYGVEHAGFRPKPERAAFDAIFAQDGVTPSRAAMFEDDVRNLAAPHDMGMRTVHVAPSPIEVAHIHHHTNDLSDFLAKVI